MRFADLHFTFYYSIYDAARRFQQKVLELIRIVKLERKTQCIKLKPLHLKLRFAYYVTINIQQKQIYFVWDVQIAKLKN